MVEGWAATFYLQARQVFSVAVTPGEQFVVGIPKPLLELPAGALFFMPPIRSFDISMDGASFLGLLTRPAAQEVPPSDIQLTLNAFEDLRSRAPAKQ